MRFLVLAIGALALAGCVTGAKGSARRQCFEAGFQPKTPEFSNCWKTIRDRDMADTTPFLVTGAIVAAAVQHQNAPPVYGEDRRPATRQCVYWTKNGKRVTETVNGYCPGRYGD